MKKQRWEPQRMSMEPLPLVSPAPIPGILKLQVRTDLDGENELTIKLSLPQNGKRVSANRDLGWRCTQATGHLKFVTQMGSNLIWSQT